MKINNTVIFIALGILGAIAVGYVLYRKAQRKKQYKPKPAEHSNE